MGCRLEKSRQWAIRCVHEAQLHQENSFLTLTYNDDSLPLYNNLQKTDLQKFFKRLRKRLGEKKIRYFACGEYGDLTKRPHYHVCLFGHDFHDKILYKQNKDYPLYISPQLTEIWGLGHCTTGELNFETAAYTARYIVKKKLGNKGAQAVHLDETTGEITALQQPYATMSLRDAIAKQWHQKYHRDIYNSGKDFIMMRGKKLKPPKYYDKLLEETDNDKYEYIKSERIRKAQPLTDKELHARENNIRAHAQLNHKREI